MTNDHLLFGRYADTSVISSLVLDGKSVSDIELLSLNDSGQLVSLSVTALTRVTPGDVEVQAAEPRPRVVPRSC